MNALLSVAVALSALAADTAVKEPGDLWEVTSQMSMEGMPMAMPANTQRVCAPKTWTEPPGGGPDKSCQTTEFKNSGTSVTWKMRCAGPPAVTGQGEITRTSPEAYKGTMTMAMEGQGTMTMKLSGRRVGDCDGGETKRQVEAIKAQASAATAQAADAQVAMCKATVEAMDLKSMSVYASMCPDLQKMFCDKLETTDGFQRVCEREEGAGTSLAEAASHCGKTVAALKKPKCDDALKNLSFDLLGKVLRRASPGAGPSRVRGAHVHGPGGLEVHVVLYTLRAGRHEGRTVMGLPIP
jgi:hypothetical protein